MFAGAERASGDDSVFARICSRMHCIRATTLSCIAGDVLHPAGCMPLPRADLVGEPKQRQRHFAAYIGKIGSVTICVVCHHSIDASSLERG